MRIRQLSRNTRRITFQKPGEGLRFIAGMNESNGCYESAARLYREAGDEEAAKRCETMHLRLNPFPSNSNSTEKPHANKI